MRQKFDLIIIGASFAGLILANSLRNSGMKIALIEKNESILRSNPNKRTTAISAGNADFLIETGFKEDFFENCGKIENIRIKEENSHFPINYHNTDKTMCYVADNSYFLENLLKNIQDENIQIFIDKSFQKIEQDDHWVKINFEDGAKLQTNLLIAADGKNSAVRDYLKLPFYKKNYQQNALVFNIEHEHDHQNNALELFTVEGPFALLPKFEKNQSSVIWTLEEKHASDYVQIEKEILGELLEEKINHFLGKININSEISSYPLSLTYFKEYYYKRILFIGDALHAIHPIAGQGLNLSIADIKVLSKILRKSYSLGSDLGFALRLQEFKSKRKMANWAMIQATDKLNSIYRNDNRAVQFLKNSGSFLIDNCSFLKKNIINYAMGLTIL